MPRRLRCLPPGIPAHIVHRGNNRQICFTSNADMAAYANWLEEGAARFDVAIHSWVFMTNHLHLLMTPRREDGISKLMQYVGRYYVRYFNHAYGRTGTLFEGRFNSNLVQHEHYFLRCQRYIELNPVRAAMVADPGDYVWSSYRAHALGSVSPKLWTPHETYLALGHNPTERCAGYRELFKQELGREVLDEIRSCLNGGIVFGTDRFRDEMEALTGVSQRRQRRGPKKKK